MPLKTKAVICYKANSFYAENTTRLLKFERIHFTALAVAADEVLESHIWYSTKLGVPLLSGSPFESRFKKEGVIYLTSLPQYRKGFI